MKIIGIDASLTSTGVAYLTDDLLLTSAIKSKFSGVQRLIQIRDLLKEDVEKADLVVIENYAFARANQAHQIGELGGVLRVMFHEAGVRWIAVAPAQVKKFATGKGNATKEQIAAYVQKNWGKMFPTNDETDAFILAMIGRAHLTGTDGLYSYQVDVINGIKSERPPKIQRKRKPEEV